MYLSGYWATAFSTQLLINYIISGSIHSLLDVTFFSSSHLSFFSSPFFLFSPENALDEISLANHSQFLMLSMGSLRRLAHQLMEKGVVSYLIPSWEETLALEGHLLNGDQQNQYEKTKKDHGGAILEREVRKYEEKKIFLSFPLLLSFGVYLYFSSGIFVIITQS